MTEALSETEIANFVLDAPPGSIRAIGRMEASRLRNLLDASEPTSMGRRALSFALRPSPATETIVETALNVLATTALNLWPSWQDEPVNSNAADTSKPISAGAYRRWAEQAKALAALGRPPRVAGTQAATELDALTHVISPNGLILAIDAENVASSPHGAAWVRALEWIAQHIHGAIVLLFDELPSTTAPFDHVLYEAINVSAAPKKAEAPESAPWIAPWRGLPHPMSDIEKRLAAALVADKELRGLFSFNQTIPTARGGRPKVDLVWQDGRLAIEIDGYSSHGNRISFIEDRHRDYELILSGFTVLRITNDEIADDLEKGIEKIRDVVRFCRGHKSGN